MFELNPVSIAVMLGITVVMAFIFVVCIRKELK